MFIVQIVETGMELSEHAISVMSVKDFNSLFQIAEIKRSWQPPHLGREMKVDFRHSIVTERTVIAEPLFFGFKVLEGRRRAADGFVDNVTQVLRNTPIATTPRPRIVKQKP